MNEYGPSSKAREGEAFITRFQESVASIIEDVESGTKTQTRIAREEDDESLVIPVAGTHTIQHKEQPDENVIDPIAGTKTITEVSKEGSDEDPQSQTFHYLPRS